MQASACQRSPAASVRHAGNLNGLIVYRVAQLKTFQAPFTVRFADERGFTTVEHVLWIAGPCGLYHKSNGGTGARGSYLGTVVVPHPDRVQFSVMKDLIRQLPKARLVESPQVEITGDVLENGLRIMIVDAALHRLQVHSDLLAVS